MNKIQIEIYCNKRDPLKYSVRVPGWRDYKRFKTKKEAERWVVDYRRFINNNLRNVFSLNSSLTGLYWDYFFELSGYDANRYGNDIKDLIDRSCWIFRNHGKESSHVPLNTIGSVYDIQRELILRFKSYSRRNKMYHLSNKIKSISYQYNLFIDDFYDVKFRVTTASSSETKIINLNKDYRIAQ